MAAAFSTTGKTLAFLPLLGVASPFSHAAEAPFPSLSPFSNQPEPWVTGSRVGQTAAIAAPVVPLAAELSMEANEPQFLAQVLPSAGATNTQVSVDEAGQQFEIRGGIQAGENLFHRFDQLDLEAGQSAEFLTSSGLEVIFSQIGGDASLIDGLLKVSGSSADLFLLNPNGIVFGPNARLDLGGAFTATTADRLGVGEQWIELLGEGITAQTAVAGSVEALEFSADAPGGAIANQAQLAVVDGQSLRLLGYAVVNTGSLTAPGGEVTILSASGGQRVSLGGGLLNLDLAESTTGATPAPRLSHVVAKPVAEATGLNLNADGSVSLQAGTSIVSGQVDVSSAEAAGGQVKILGDEVQLTHAVVDASGAAGGEISVGGDYQGRGRMLRAVSTRLDEASVLRADGLASTADIRPDGGEVVVWSDGTAEFAGTATARSLAPGGDGGLVETSGKQRLNISSTADVNTTSLDGATGQWLIDPVDLTVVNGGGAAAIIGGVNDPGASTIDAATVEAGLNGNNVRLQADNSITVAAPINTSANPSGGDLNLDAPTLQFNERITLRAGSELSGTAAIAGVVGNGSIQNGVDAVVSGGTVTLVGTAPSPTTYREGREIIVDKPIRLVGPGADLTHVSGDANGDGNAVGNQADNHRILNLTSNADGTTLSGITFSDGVASSDGPGLNNDADDVTIEDSVFVNNQLIGAALDGGAIHTRGQRLRIDNTRFENNYAEGDGGAIDIENGSVDISNSQFSDNIANSGHGGAIDVDPNGSLMVTNTVFERNSARTDGGAIYAGGLTTLDGADFQDNVAQSDGGAIYVERNVTSVSNGSSFSSNTAVSGNGGAIHLRGSGQLNIADSSFSGNQAGNHGGALSTVSSNSNSLAIDGTTFTGNQAASRGGALLLESSNGTIQLTDVLLQNNSAQDGGGVYKGNNADLSWSSGTLDGNTATNLGGGFVGDGAGNISLDLITFQNNSAVEDGGALHLGNGNELTGQNLTFVQNMAQDDGGAIDIAGGSVLALTDSTIERNQAVHQGGAVDVDSGAHLKLTRGIFRDNQAADGGAIVSNGGLISAMETQFISNQASGSGGAITQTDDAVSTLNDITFTANTAENFGGAIANQGNSNSQLAITGGSFSNNQVLSTNSAMGDGGAIFAGGDSVTTVSGTLFSENTATFDGGAIAAEGAAQLDIDGASFQNNQSLGDNGGALFIIGDSRLQLINSIVESNVSAQRGGGLFQFQNAQSTIQNTRFTNNQAATDGGAISLISTGIPQLIVTGSTFDSNSAQDDGGGVFLDARSGGAISFDQTSFTNNDAVSGGGIYKIDNSDVSVSNSVFERNTATEHGGGLFAAGSGGTITIADSNFVQNVAGIDGGGIRITNNNLLLSNSRILTNQANFGGGVELSSSSNAQVNNSLFQGNVSSAHGGAISIDDTSSATITTSQILNNQSGFIGGGIFTNNSLSIDTSLIQANTAANDGGGIALDGPGGAVSIRSTTVNGNSALNGSGGGLSHVGSQILLIEDSTFNSNSVTSGNGGGLDLNPTLITPSIQLRNSTISSNTSTDSGGAMSLGASAQVNLNNVTVANNIAGSGGGLNNPFGGSLTLQNSIVAQNRATTNPDIAGALTSLGNNIVQVRGTSTGYVGADLPDGTDPLLLSLANNGGLTETHAVRANSLAVDGGNASATAADQRSLSAVNQRDIGAYELDNALTFAITGSGQTQTVNQAFTNPIGVTVTDSLGGVVAGLDIDVAAPGAGASASFGALQTDSSGVASTTATANTVAGSYSVNLGITGNSSIGAVALTNTADSPAQLVVLNGSNQSTVVNTAFGNPLSVAVTDQFGNQIPFQAVSVNLPGSGASAVATNGFDFNALNLVTDSSGQATIGLTANMIAGSYIGGLTAGSLSNNISLTNLPDVPSRLALLNGNNQSTVVNTTFSNPLQVEVTDQFGNAVPGVVVGLSLPTTGATANPDAIALTTDATGQATTGLTANTIAGSYSLDLSAAGLANAVALANLPDAPARLDVLDGDGQSTVVNTAFANPLQVEVQDQFGNVVPGAVVNLSLPVAGASTNAGSISLTTDALGQATTSLVANTVAGSYGVGLAAGSASNSISLGNLPDAPAQLDLLGGDGQVAPVNSAFAEALRVQVLDQFGNVIPGVTVNFSMPAAVGSGEASAALSPGAVSTDGTGQGQTLAIANDQAGLYQVQAQASGLTAAFDLENQAPPLPPEPPVVVPPVVVPPVVSPPVVVPPTPTPETPPVLGPSLPELPSGTELPLASLPPTQPVEKPSGSSPTANAPLSLVNTTAIQEIDSSFSSAYTNYWGQPESRGATVAETRALLKNAGEAYGVRSAVVYALFVPQDQADNESFGATQVASMALNRRAQTSEQRDDDQLMLVLVADQGAPIQQIVDGATRREVLQQARLFRMAASDPYDEWSYKPLAQQLYSWMLQPVEPELERFQLDNVMYVMDAGLRTLPLAAMMKGDEFAIERYGISLIPSVDLMETNFGASVPSSQIVAAGATEFERLNDLPAVEIELDAIAAQASESGQSKSHKKSVNVLFNEDFTQENLLQAQQQGQANMLHLATHGEFNAGDLGSSYLQFWDDQLTLDEISKLGWDELELLILSACQTAISSPEAELGFAGLAASTGVESTIGSLWSVSDLGTLGLMSEFYGQLSQTPLRFEALRQAQMAMLRGETRLNQQQLQTDRGEIALPEEWDLPESADFSHPFFWSGFTLVGNPWW